MTIEEAVAVLNANAHLWHTDWRVGKYSGAVFCGSQIVSPEEAILAAKSYLHKVD